MKKISLLFILPMLVLVFFTGWYRSDDNLEKEWKTTDEILKNIKAPEFANKTFDITNFGAVSDNKTLNTKSINDAIEAAFKKGGGKVVVPAGTFLTGAVHLKSNVVLHLDENAVLIFSTNPAHYLPNVLTRWEGVDCYNYSPLIYAYEQENIGITGKGKLDGMATEENWLKWKGRRNADTPSQSDPQGRPMLMKFNNDQVPVEERIFGEGHYLRPPFIQFYKCKNIIIEDITIENSPFWIIHPLLSENITVRGVSINSNGANNDGCDPESCKNVLIENCFFNTGDDCIALKSGRNNDGRRWNVPVENIIVRNCKMKNGHGGIVIGSEISGGAKNIFVENCEMSSPELDRAIRIKTNSQRGGMIEDFYVRNITVGQVKESVIKIECVYEPAEGEGKFIPSIKNVYVNNVSSKKSPYAVHMVGITGQKCIDSIFISKCDFEGVEKGSLMKNTGEVIFTNVKINGKELN